MRRGLSLSFLLPYLLTLSHASGFAKKGADIKHSTAGELLLLDSNRRGRFPGVPIELSAILLHSV